MAKMIDLDKMISDINDTVIGNMTTCSQEVSFNEDDLKEAIKKIKDVQDKRPYLICNKKRLPSIQRFLSQNIPIEQWQYDCILKTKTLCLESLFDIKTQDVKIEKPMILRKGWIGKSPEELLKQDIQQTIFLDIF